MPDTATAARSRIFHELDFDKPGKQIGYLRVPQSRDDGERTRAGHTFKDAGWPGQPNLASNVALSEDEAAALAAEFAARWRT